MESKKKKLKMTRSVSTSIERVSTFFLVMAIVGLALVPISLCISFDAETGTFGSILLVSSLVFTIINFILSKLVSGLFVIVNACELYSAINEQKFDIEIVNEIEEEE